MLPVRVATKKFKIQDSRCMSPSIIDTIDAKDVHTTMSLLDKPGESSSGASSIPLYIVGGVATVWDAQSESRSCVQHTSPAVAEVPFSCGGAALVPHLHALVAGPALLGNTR